MYDYDIFVGLTLKSYFLPWRLVSSGKITIQHYYLFFNCKDVSLTVPGAAMRRYSVDEIGFMQQALTLAAQVKGSTHPNPAVGAVIVAGNSVVGKGATAPWGGPHAEKTAIRHARDDARGATLFVSLEPCCHHGRTPPCTDAIIAAGIKKVFIASRDPNPLIAGKGIRILRQHGIDVLTGLLKKEADSLNSDFFWAITHKSTYISLKLALTLDGRVADSSLHSQWITTPASRKIVHLLRGEHSAVAVGAATLASDNAQLTVRYGRARNPARIVFAAPRCPPANTGYFYSHAHECRTIMVFRGGSGRSITKDPCTGIEHWETGCRERLQSLRAFSEMAFEQNLISVLVEGGSRIASALMEAQLVNKLYLFYGNHLIGDGLPGFVFKKGLPLNNAITLTERTTELIGNDFLLSGTPHFPDKTRPLGQ